MRPSLTCLSTGILVSPKALLRKINTAATTIATIAASSSSQSQPPLVPLAEALTPRDDAVTQGQNTAIYAIIAAPPAITYPRFCCCLSRSMFIDNPTFRAIPRAANDRIFFDRNSHYLQCTGRRFIHSLLLV